MFTQHPTPGQATGSLSFSLGSFLAGRIRADRVHHVALFDFFKICCCFVWPRPNALKLAWININTTSTPCLICYAMGQSTGACSRERRYDLPFEICLGMGEGVPHSEPNCMGPAADNLADLAHVSVIFFMISSRFEQSVLSAEAIAKGCQLFFQNLRAEGLAWGTMRTFRSAIKSFHIALAIEDPWVKYPALFALTAGLQK